MVANPITGINHPRHATPRRKPSGPREKKENKSLFAPSRSGLEDADMMI
jgi:hypothetical protein